MKRTHRVGIASSVQALIGNLNHMHKQSIVDPNGRLPSDDNEVMLILCAAVTINTLYHHANRLIIHSLPCYCVVLSMLLTDAQPQVGFLLQSRQDVGPPNLFSLALG